MTVGVEQQKIGFYIARNKAEEFFVNPSFISIIDYVYVYHKCMEGVFLYTAAYLCASDLFVFMYVLFV